MGNQYSDSKKKVQKRPEWKQDTPRMQLIGLIGSAWGDTANASCGIASKEALLRAVKHLEQAQEILRDMPEGEWE